MMSQKTKLFFAIVLCLLLAAGSLLWALASVGSIYAFRSPLHAAPPAPGMTLGAPSSRQVVFVLIDGLRYDTATQQGVMPVLHDLRTRGASARMVSQTPSYSAPAYSVLLTGAWPYLSDGPAFNMVYEHIPALAQDNLFSAASRNGLGTAVSGYYWFEKLIPAGDTTASFYTPGEDQYADRDVLDAALPWLGTEKFDFILIHIDQVDYAGHHEGGPLDPRWDAAAARSDALLGEIISRLDLTQDTVLVCSDHGHIDLGGHGGSDPIVIQQPFVLAGAHVRPGVYDDVQMVDVAPTLAVLLGTNLPAISQGTPRVEMLADLPQDLLTNLDEAIIAQQQLLLADYTTAIGQPVDASALDGASVSAYQDALETARQARLRSERFQRGLLAIAIAAILITLYVRQRDEHTVWVLLGGFLYLLLFNLGYLLLGGKVYSYSAVTAELNLIVDSGLLCVVCTLLVGVMLSWRLGWWKLSKLEAALRRLRLAFVLVFLAALPAGFSFVWNGALVSWTLPELGTHFLGLLSQIQVIFISLGGLLLAGLGAGWSSYSAWRRR
jgi:hypothetical protein